MGELSVFFGSGAIPVETRDHSMKGVEDLNARKGAMTPDFAGVTGAEAFPSLSPILQHPLVCAVQMTATVLA
eukprot:1639264-Rhodomonas_salina.4